MPYLEELRKRQILKKSEPAYMAAYMPNMAM